jgi:dihydroneopterin aldolase
VHDHELGAPQRLQFDIYVMLSGVSEPSADEIGEVLDYEYLISALDETLEMNRAALLETLANRLLDRILEPNSAEGASVILTKLDVLEGDGQLGCSMTRLK